ncbi:MAG: hypothetical protein ACOYK6_00935 [Chthoniobacterales bacterium]
MYTIFLNKLCGYTVALVFLMISLTSIKNARAFDFSVPDSKEDIIKIIRFLTADVNNTTSDLPSPGLTYVGTAGNLRGKKLPLSFFCTNEYWQQYVLQLPGETSVSKDLYNPADNSLTPMPGSRGQLQVERINIRRGCNIYDAATWQIALALAGNDGLKGDKAEDLFVLAQNQSCLLNLGHDGNDDGDSNKQGAPHMDANRGVTFGGEQKKFVYNGCEIRSPKEAYFFRAIPQNFKNEDPLPGSVEVEDSNGNKIPIQDLPDNQGTYPKICIDWTDWKAITGENIWSFLIGPLHSALIQYKKSPCVPFQTLAVQNAIAVLGAFQKMQSKIGAIYYAPAGSLSNMGTEAVSPYEVSVENNISALGGLLVFKRVLQDELLYGYCSGDERMQINEALTKIKSMLYGGNYYVVLRQWESQRRETRGLLSFLKNEAWNHTTHEFYSGGEANKVDANGQPTQEWIPHELKAVDVNTWGLAVLGQRFIDDAHGVGAAYELWQRVKDWGGYYGDSPNGSDKELWGVGYSDHDHDGNGKIDPNDRSGILSGEWTAGAINAVRVLITQYQAACDSGHETPENLQKIKGYLNGLQKDHDSMVKHIQSLRTDQYAEEAAFNKVRPSNYKELISIPTNKLGYLYASKRYLIPFGWYANPIPSMASTTWVVMLHYNFNPFSAKGDYVANDL